MTTDYDIMIAGHLCLDIIPRFNDNGSRDISKIMCPGKLVNVEEAEISTGGLVSNTGFNMKTLGSKVCYCASTGDDVLGKITVDLLKKNGNADGIKMLKGKESSYSIVVAPPGIDRIFLHSPGTNKYFGPETLDLEQISRCKHFHMGYPPLMSRMFANEGKEMAEIFKIAKDAGASTSCDMTLPDPESDSGKAPWRKILENTLPYIDFFVPSVEETFYMLYPQEFLQMKKEHNNEELIKYLSPEKYSSIAEELLDMGTRLVTLKSGYRGFYLRSASADKFDDSTTAIIDDPENWASRELWNPAYKVKKIGSATGAGDSTVAGFLAAYLRGLSLEKSLKYASCLGYQNISALDAISGIKDWDTTTEMVESNIPMEGAELENSDWRYKDETKLFYGPNDCSSIILEEATC